MSWLLYTLFEIFVWNFQFRNFLVNGHPIIHMGASALNDFLWLPLAIALPIHIVYLLRKLVDRLIIRESLTFFVVMFTVVSIANIDFLFRMQFLYLIAFFILLPVYIYRSGKVSIRLLSFCVALLGMILHYRTQLLPPMISKPQRSISIMSFNFNTKVSYDDERTVQFIRRRIPDIVFLQELSYSEKKIIMESLSDIYPHYLAPGRRQGKNDVLILSRIKMLYGDHIPLKTSNSERYHSVNHAVIRTEGHTINLVNCHLHHAYLPLGRYLSDPDSAQHFENVKRAYCYQWEQARRLKEYVGRLTGPTIIAGDFNDTPNGYIYNLFDDSYQNAFATAGWGLGATFGKWTLQRFLPNFLRGLAFGCIRIDHVFLSREFKVLSSRVESVGAFDHYPQMIKVALK